MTLTSPTLAARGIAYCYVVLPEERGQPAKTALPCFSWLPEFPLRACEARYLMSCRQCVCLHVLSIVFIQLLTVSFCYIRCRPAHLCAGQKRSGAVYNRGLLPVPQSAGSHPPPRHTLVPGPCNSSNPTRCVGILGTRLAVLAG